MPQLANKPLTWPKRDAKQPRKLPERDEDLPPEVRAELVRLGESLREKQLQPILCLPDGTILAGERRWRAARLVGLPTIEVKIADEPLTEAQISVWQMVENMQRADLTAFEQWEGIVRLEHLHPGVLAKDLAKLLSLDPSSITRMQSPSKCIPEVQEALRAGRLTISDTYAISKLPPEDQPALLQLKLGGASRDVLEMHGRKKRAKTAPTVRTNRIRVPLVGGATVTVAGEEVSLEEAIEAMSEAMKLARAALAKGLNARTAMNVWKDVAAAG